MECVLTKIHKTNFGEISYLLDPCSSSLVPDRSPEFHDFRRKDIYTNLWYAKFLFSLFSEINRVRMALFQCHFSIERLDLPEPEGEPVTIQEKVYVPRKEHPDVNHFWIE